jgi:hypothetical protein
VAGSQITLYELWRRVERDENDIRERFLTVDARIAETALRGVPRDVYEERHQATLRRVETVEDILDAARIYRRNLTVAIVASVVASIGAVVASLLAVLVHP